MASSTAADSSAPAGLPQRDLPRRMGEAHYARRLALEEHRGIDLGQGWFRVENWPGSRHVIRSLLALLGQYARAQREARSIELIEHDLPIRGLPRAFTGYTVLQLSDVHIDIAEDACQLLIEAVRSLRYDLCVLTGDYRARTSGPWERALQGMARLCEHLRAPAYGVMGNHDSIRMVGELEALGLRMLMNENIELERGGERLWLAGVDDPHYFRTHDVERARAGIAPDAASLLLAHSPEIYADAERANFAGVLCGHTHGGQLCLPGGIPITSNARCPRRMVAGAWAYGRLAGYTSRGSGASVVDLRLNCPPEVTLHRLEPAPAAE